MKKRLIKYIRMLEKGIIGISIELIYPLIVTISAFLFCLIMFISEISFR
ncbi:MAG TPA: hypothetical protein P5065_03385 [Candidatus Ratteibacteria bacterium]|jgi:hypothetical protein|uniref:Uncharacterized protein n=1 Tax=candidate division TA06 bacterium ADurb.Bin131 TaxID=1852827 RepID=A0A1V6C5U0_UNCT6|nr:MAG: hypothetical protein BWX89_01368 [candidate division TA06 bacterium ADurb.Bin131]HOC03572.1 hypothetical protein [bacterium]HRS06070.1 hypothetical protein [Candidatus Ratteibacteria bacterium]HON06060.1 hypothetical protein [bacterium]HPC29207.1 hypothetical protein [bacterium]